MTILHTLSSGSSGNALILSRGETHLLVDAGISCRRITASMRSLEVSPADLSAILITHAHTDHISGLPTLLKRTACPVLASEETCSELAFRIAGIEGRLEPLPFCRERETGGFTVTAFPAAHDSPGTCGFRLDSGDGGVGILTDTGSITEAAEEILPGVVLAVLEANHDVETLRSGPYPYSLKRRILGPSGHLCNEDAARFAVTLAGHGASELILAHLSRENNTPAMALHAVSLSLSAAGLSPLLSVAPRETLSEAHIVTGRTVCKR